MTNSKTVEIKGVRATITEQGNGMAGVGDYVAGDDGQLYRATAPEFARPLGSGRT